MLDYILVYSYLIDIPLVRPTVGSLRSDSSYKFFFKVACHRLCVAPVFQKSVTNVGSEVKQVS